LETKQQRISASGLKSLEKCSYAFYLTRYLKLPEKTWPRTHVGTIVHSILEMLRLEKHRKHYEAVMLYGSIYGSKAIERLVKFWIYKVKLASDLVGDLDPMAMLVLNKTNFMDIGATETFPPEHEFTLNLPNGAVIRGYIDRLARHGDVMKIWDYKSQRERFTSNELTNNFQAMTYQLYVWKHFKLPAEVTFVQLRHPPTSRTPQKHLQIVPPATPDQLAGFEEYLEHIYQVLQGFGLKEAYSNFCNDFGFCKNVCTFFKPFRYISVKKKDTKELVGNYMIDNVPQLKDNEYSEELEFSGCPKHNGFSNGS
jgi:RecB family exonuclease